MSGPVGGGPVGSGPVGGSAATRTRARGRWLVLAGVAVLGVLGFATASPAGLRAGLSFLGGLALATGSFEFGAFNIRFVGRYAPGLTMAVALLSYFTTAVALGLVLAASSPRVVDGPAIATGLFSGLVIWLGGELAAARAVQEHH